MRAQHTTGPWTVQELDSLFRVVDSRALKFGNSRLCDVQQWSTSNRGPSREEAKANARLMAAAPDLLEAAKLVLLAWYEAEDDHAKADLHQRMQMCRDSEAAIRAAIEKAEGT